MATFPSVEDFRLIQIGIQYGAYVKDSGTVDQLYAARNLGRQIEARLLAVGGDTGYTLEQLEQAETPKTVPESATIGFDNVTDKSVLVFWNPHSNGNSPITGYHLILKNEDTGQTIIELNPNANTTNYFFQNLDSATNYKAYVIVINAIGNSFEQSYGFKTLGVKVEPEPVITYCVNVYTLDSGGNVLSDHYDKINLSNLQNLLSENKYVIQCKENIIPTEQQVRDFYGYTAPVADSSINSTMVSQSVGSFILKDGILKGEILYIANQAQYNNENKLISGFNPFYYSKIKNLISFVQINSKSGIPLITKPNGLNFTATERDERIQIDEGHAGELQNYKEITINFLVLKSPSDMRAFASNKQIQVIETNGDGTECQINYHKDFSGKCVPDDPLPEIPRDKLIDTLKGFLFGTVALSLLARKY